VAPPASSRVWRASERLWPTLSDTEPEWRESPSGDCATLSDSERHWRTLGRKGGRGRLGLASRVCTEIRSFRSERSKGVTECSPRRCSESRGLASQPRRGPRSGATELYAAQEVPPPPFGG